MAKVLLVEDDNNLREIYEARLQAEGYDIVSASDGEQALVVAKNEKPDLVISDVMMPKISGFEMLDILRNTDGLTDVKVIMLTALGQAEDKTRADQLGANRYLVKSQVTLEDIVKTAHQLLDDTATTAPTAASGTAAPAATTSTSDTLATPTVAPAPVSDAPEPAQPSTATDAPSVVPTVPPALDPASTSPSSPAETVAATPQAVDSAAPTAAEEEAEMAAQIDTFVEQAATSAPQAEPQPDEAPALPQPAAETPITPVTADNLAPDSPAPAPDAVAAPIATPPTPDTTESTADQNDQTMSDAIKSLTGDSQRPSEVTAVEVAPDPSHIVTAASQAVPQPDPSAQPADEPASTAPTPSTDNATIAHKKVIQPLDDTVAAKPDLSALLAVEEAKESGLPDLSAHAPAAPPAPEPAEDPALQISPELQAAIVDPEATPPVEAPAEPVSPPPAVEISPVPEPATPPAEKPADDPSNIAL